MTISAAAAMCVAVCSGVPASPRKPLLRVIISVVSCRVQVSGAIALGRAGNRKLGHAATAQSRTCRSRLRGNVRQIRGICPDSCAWPRPDRNSALVKSIRTDATGSRAPDGRRPGSTMASNSGELHRVQASAPVWREYPSRAAPCGRLGRPVTHATDGYPLRGPRARNIDTGSRRRSQRAPALCQCWCPTWDAAQTAWHLLSGRLNGARGSPVGRLAASRSTGSTAETGSRSL